MDLSIGIVHAFASNLVFCLLLVICIRNSAVQWHIIAIIMFF